LPIEQFVLYPAAQKQTKAENQISTGLVALYEGRQEIGDPSCCILPGDRDTITV